VNEAINPLQPVLRGPTLELRPMRSDDLEPLFAVAADPLIWALHPEPTRWQRPVFERFFAGGLACGGALVAVEARSGALVGASRYYQWDPAALAVTIGYTFLARRLWGGTANAEMKRLMLDHAFTFARTAWFEVGRDNLRSRRAMEKIGAEFSGDRPEPAGSTAAPHVLYRVRAAAWRAGLA
jgi:RimJ/RimL family protein N-acetyltransferase